MSLDSGMFPDILKIAIVLPIHKKDDELQLNNFRPISLLSTFSKLFEKMVKRRLMGYLDKIKFLNCKQFGFIAGKSTEDALLHFLSNIYLAVNNSSTPIALFVDISKAFDTVDHNILLMKLKHIGVRGNILDWFASYLDNRTQVVKINNSLSSPGLIKCGVPQGSVLGPLLFLIYFNSIFDINLYGRPTAFADDLALSYAPCEDYHSVNFALKKDLCSLSKWFFYHRLVISDKSRFMSFCKPKTAESFVFVYHLFSCNRNPCSPECFEIIDVQEFRYLGLTIDSQLNWNSHICKTRKSVIAAVYKFFNLRQVCPPAILRMLYHALVESILMYGISSWGGVYFSVIKDLYIAQKRIVKIIYRCPRTTSTIPLFRKVKLQPLRYLYVFKVLKVFFVRSDSFHSRITQNYFTRNPNMFAGVRCNSEKFRRFYLYMAPYWFHKLPRHLKSLTIEHKYRFAREVRNWLSDIDDIEQYF